MPIAKTAFIASLPESIQASIRTDLTNVFTQSDTLTDDIASAMTGRLTDLEDTIDITSYIS